MTVNLIPDRALTPASRARREVGPGSLVVSAGGRAGKSES
jgi:hypothetical protein